MLPRTAATKGASAAEPPTLSSRAEHLPGVRAQPGDRTRPPLNGLIRYAAPRTAGLHARGDSGIALASLLTESSSRAERRRIAVSTRSHSARNRSTASDDRPRHTQRAQAADRVSVDCAHRRPPHIGRHGERRIGGPSSHVKSRSVSVPPWPTIGLSPSAEASEFLTHLCCHPQPRCACRHCAARADGVDVRASLVEVAAESQCVPVSGQRLIDQLQRIVGSLRRRLRGAARRHWVLRERRRPRRASLVSRGPADQLRSTANG